jgi:hypothetical protein
VKRGKLGNFGVKMVFGRKNWCGFGDDNPFSTQAMRTALIQGTEKRHVFYILKPTPKFHIWWEDDPRFLEKIANSQFE